MTCIATIILAHAHFNLNASSRSARQLCRHWVRVPKGHGDGKRILRSRLYHDHAELRVCSRSARVYIQLLEEETLHQSYPDGQLRRWWGPPVLSW